MDDVLRHIKYQINAAPLRQWPFPHLLVDEILPPEYYEEMIKWMPSASDFDSEEFGRGSSAEKHRTIIRMHATDPYARAGGWMNTNTEWFTSGALTPILTERFYLSDQAARAGHLSLILNDKRGYAIGPHMDTAAKIITMIIYTPTRTYLERDIRSLGTSFYEPKSLGWDDARRGMHYPFDKFDRIYTAPYKPNTALLFHSVNRSFHGVEPASADRMTLQYQVVDADSGFAKSRGVQHGAEAQAEAGSEARVLRGESSR